MKLALTDRFCSTIKCASVTDFFDAKSSGLALRVTPTGVKSWALFYTIPRSNKRARKVLGRYPVVGLAQARTLALEAKGIIAEGVDPRAVHGAPMTLADMIASYIGKHVSTLKSGTFVARRLTVNVLPVIGDVKLAELHRRDVNRVIDPIMARGARSEATHTFDDVRGLITWAVRRGDLDHNFMLGMGRPAKTTPRERVLSDDEIAKLWHAWPLVFNKRATLVLKLALATGQRLGEITGMTPSELDLRARVWKLPASRVKNGHAHTVPLSDLALDLIREARAGAVADERIFPGARTALIAETLYQHRAKLPVINWTGHDLRRTAATKMAELGVSPIVIGTALNHRSTTRAGMTLAVYVKHTYEAEVREALELWADRLEAIVLGGAKVLPMRKARP